MLRYALKAKTHRYLFAVVLMGACAIAQTTVSTAAAAPSAKPSRLLMWKVSSPTTTVYLFGSIHLAVKEMYPLPQPIENAFDSSKILAVEVNIKNVTEADSMQLIQQYGLYPDGDSLTRHLPAETAAALDKFCQEFGYPREALEPMKPWVVTTFVQVVPYMKAGADMKLGLDLHFLEKTKPTQLIHELETVDFQLKLLSSGTDSQQIELLNSALKHAGRVQDYKSKVIKAYQTGDPTSVEEAMKEQAAEARWFYKQAVDDRNIQMAEKVEAYLKGKEPVFMVVGLGHIIGDQGIVKLLQAKKYNVQQVTQ